jgi:hypothetical protein
VVFGPASGIVVGVTCTKGAAAALAYVASSSAVIGITGLAVRSGA